MVHAGTKDEKRRVPWRRAEAKGPCVKVPAERALASPFYDTVKVKPQLPWRPKDIRERRTARMVDWSLSKSMKEAVCATGSRHR